MRRFFKRQLVVGSASMIAFLAIGPSGTPATAVSDPVTIVTIDSEQGEYYGQGRAHTFVAPDTIQIGGAPSVIYVHVSDGAFEHRIELAAPQGGTLEVGVYENATNAGGVDPRISMTLRSLRCSNSTGRFEILEAPTFDADGHLLTFAADFEHRCGTPKTLYGSIRFKSSVPVRALDVSAPPNDQVDLGTGTVMIAGAPTTFTLTNVGNQSLSLTGVTTGGTHPGSFLVTSECPASLAPGASCTFDVVLRAVTSGANVGTLTIGSDAVRWGRDIDLVGSATFALASNTTSATAIVIGSLPFGHGGSLGGAPGTGGWNACPGDYGSLWYRYSTATKKRIQLDPSGSESPVALMVRSGAPNVAPFACGQDQPVEFTAEPNVTYWVQLQRKYHYLRQGEGLVLQAREGEPDTTVQASGLGVSASTFYPYPDKYRDTVAIKGTRGEKASTAISIYAPTGAKVRTFAVAAALGPYSVAWNGRNTSGTLLAAGEYKVVQTVTDLWGNKLSET
jgi:hypothetical protein